MFSNFKKGLSKRDSYCIRIAGLFCFLLLGFSSLSQTRKDTLCFFYEVDQYDATPFKSRMDSIATSLKNVNMNLQITGYADYLSGRSYNLTLSKKRAEGIKELVRTVFDPEQIKSMTVDWKGESQSKDIGGATGDQYFRRVDLIIEKLEPMKSSEEKRPVIRKDSKSAPKKLEDLEKGESLSVEGLNFEPGRHYILRSGIPVLENLLKTMQENPGLKIEIQGHICCQHDEGDGLDVDTRIHNLSESRAKAVYDYLVANKIDKTRLSYKGFGHSKPKVSPERTPADEQANRRVEVLVLEK